jgi:pimeloyl-ACP methyl ester carboxylesterase
MWKMLNIDKWSCTTLCIDLPGHGESNHLLPEDEPTIERMAEMVIQILNFLKIHSFHLVGHSMGGYISLVIKKRIASCKKLVLLNSTYLPDSNAKKQDRLRMAEMVFHSKQLIISQSIPRLFYNRPAKDSIVKKIIAEAKTITPEAMAYASIAMRNRSNHFNIIQHYKNDTLIITGKFDTIINTVVLKEAAEKFDLNLIELPNSGHMSHFEDTDLLKNILLDFTS